MPYIEAKLTISLSDDKKDELQKKLTDIVSSDMSKPKAYIMCGIDDNSSISMAGEMLDKGAYIDIKYLGNPKKETCLKITKEICLYLKEEYKIEGDKVYISFAPYELWGYDSFMF